MVKYSKLVTFILTLLALITMLPYPGASEVNMIGYKSVSSYSPAITAVLFVTALAIRYCSIEIAYRKRTENKKRKQKAKP